MHPQRFAYDCAEKINSLMKSIDANDADIAEIDPATWQHTQKAVRILRLALAEMQSVVKLLDTAAIPDSEDESRIYNDERDPMFNKYEE